MPSVVFVQGACVRDQGWWWRRMVEPLADRGLATAAVDLPSCAPAPGRLPGLADDVAATRAVLDGVPAPVLLCGHSYGGMVITGAGTHQAVAHLAYLAAAVPDAGESMASTAGPEPAPWMDPGTDGTVGVHPALIAERFLWDLDPETVEGALARLTRQSAAPFGEAPEAVAWRSVPSTYLVCAEDRAVPAERQREWAARTRSAVELPTGHFPFLSAPELLADALADALAA